MPCSPASTSTPPRTALFLHTALRRPASEKGQLIVDGQDVVADVHEVLDRMYVPLPSACAPVEWKGVTGKKIEHLVSIGIGGSDRSGHGLRGPASLRRRRVSTAAISPTSTPTTRPRSSRALIPRPRS